MLTLAYSIFQGNVGTAYRQRSQILVFYFIFVAVGYVLMKERREDSKRRESMSSQALTESARAAQERRRGGTANTAAAATPKVWSSPFEERAEGLRRVAASRRRP
jgi:hypothetical protein